MRQVETQDERRIKGETVSVYTCVEREQYSIHSSFYDITTGFCMFVLLNIVVKTTTEAALVIAEKFSFCSLS